MARHRRFDPAEPTDALRPAPVLTTRPDLADRPRQKSRGRGRFARGLGLTARRSARRPSNMNRSRRAPAPTRAGSGAACPLLRRTARENPPTLPFRTP